MKETIINFPEPDEMNPFMQSFAKDATTDLLSLVRRISDFHDQALERGDIDGSEPKRRFILRVLRILLDPMLDDLEQRGLI